METIFGFENPQGSLWRGFSKPVSIGTLQKFGCDDISSKPGVYLVLQPEKKSRPVFLARRRSGHYEDTYPSYSVDCLKDKWINDCIVLYIGKAGGPRMKATLKKRISQLVRFGQGKCKTHGGGRSVWQIPESQDLLISWRDSRAGQDTPKDVERRLLEDFKRRYDDQLPFANRRC